MQKRRKTYLVNRRYQLKYVGTFMGIALVAVILSAFMLLEDITRQIEVYIQKPTIEVSRTGEIILPIVLRDSAMVSALLLAVLILMSVFYYFHTRRLEKNLDRCITSFGSGRMDFCPNIGYGVDFGAMERSFNNMLDSNRKRLASAQGYSQDIAREIDHILANSDDSWEVDGRLKNLQRKVEGLEKELSFFRTD